MIHYPLGLTGILYIKSRLLRVTGIMVFTNPKISPACRSQEGRL